jgi:hypothetical protein
MSQKPNLGSLHGKWTYRSFLPISDVNTPFNDLEFGRGTITIAEAPMGVLAGTIGGAGWQLELSGSINYGDPYSVRFQGRGVLAGAEWIYDYQGYVIKPWPNGIDQVPTIVGSIVRTIPHPDGSGGVAPAGVVCAWVACWQGKL